MQSYLKRYPTKPTFFSGVIYQTTHATSKRIYPTTLQQVVAILFFILLSVCHTTDAVAQRSRDEVTRILFLFDASNSMNADWEGEKKIDIARRVLLKMVDSLATVPNLEMGLRIYGHQSPVPPPDCNDTKLEVAFGAYNADLIKQKLNSIVPKGTTPIALSLERAANDFPPRTDCRNVIILITDGIEACDGDPCAAALALQRSGVILTPFVIGVGLDLNIADAFKCMGKYYDASSPGQLETILTTVVTEATVRTTAQVNLYNIYKQAKETNVNMTFYDVQTGAAKYNFIHTLNAAGNPDTLEIDPLISYRIVVHTLPPVVINNVQLKTSQHNIIQADAPQGSLVIKDKVGNTFKDLQFFVYSSMDCNTLNVQKMYTTEKYIVGKYDIEIPVLPRLFLEDVAISQDQTTVVEVDWPGLVTFNSASEGYGSIYVERGNELVWVCNLKTELTQEVLRLQPGKYRAVYRPKKMQSSAYTVERNFEVTPGRSLVVDLNRSN